MQVPAPVEYERATSVDEAISLLERKLLPWKKVVTIAQLVHGQAIFDELASGSSAIMKAVFEV